MALFVSTACGAGLEGSSNPNGAFIAELSTSNSSVKYEKASRFDFSVYQSSFGVNMSDSAYEGSLHVTGKLEGDFAYGNGNLKLRQGFANFFRGKIFQIMAEFPSHIIAE